MPSARWKEALALLDDSLKEDKARVNEQRALNALDDSVPLRIAAKGRKHIDLNDAASLDWLACGYNDIWGLNLDEYKKRCRIRKMHYTPEQYKEDTELFKKLGKDGYKEHKTEQLRKERD